MQHLHQQHPGMDVAETARALGLSRSGFCAHARKPLRKRRSGDAALGLEIERTFIAARRTYGSPRILHALRQAGLRHGKNRIARLRRARGLRVRQKRRFVPRTTLAGKDAPVAPNHLLERPAAVRPNQIWLTDITYIPTAEGWLYLAAEMDAFSRRIIGWSTLASLHTELPVAALDRALDHRHRGLPARPPPPQRPRLPTHQLRVSPPALPLPHHPEHEPQGPRLRQRRQGVLLGHSQVRMLRLPPPADPRRGSFHDF
jgi:transposase InsO family protein